MSILCSTDCVNCNAVGDNDYCCVACLEMIIINGTPAECPCPECRDDIVECAL